MTSSSTTQYLFYFTDLYMTHIGRCAKFQDPCPEKLKYIKTATPVCGSDNRSYISYDALLCAQFRVDNGKYQKYLTKEA